MLSEYDRVKMKIVTTCSFTSHTCGFCVGFSMRACFKKIYIQPCFAKQYTKTVLVFLAKLLVELKKKHEFTKVELCQKRPQTASWDVLCLQWHYPLRHKWIISFENTPSVPILVSFSYIREVKRTQLWSNIYKRLLIFIVHNK